MLKQYLKSKSGSFSIYFALAMTTLLVGVGVSVDYTGISRAKTEMQNLADSTALAAAISANNEEVNRRQIALDFYNAHVANLL